MAFYTINSMHTMHSPLLKSPVSGQITIIYLKERLLYVLVHDGIVLTVSCIK